MASEDSLNAIASDKPSEILSDETNTDKEPWGAQMMCAGEDPPEVTEPCENYQNTEVQAGCCSYMHPDGYSPFGFYPYGNRFFNVYPQFNYFPGHVCPMENPAFQVVTTNVH